MVLVWQRHLLNVPGYVLHALEPVLNAVLHHIVLRSTIRRCCCIHNCTLVPYMRNIAEATAAALTTTVTQCMIPQTISDL